MENDWDHVPLINSATEKMTGMVLHAHTQGFIKHNSPVSIYSSLFLMPKGKSALEIHVERFWERPYLMISAAQVMLWFEGISVLEADKKHTEVFLHMKGCPDILSSNGEYVAKCSHYPVFILDDMPEERCRFFDS